MTAVGRELGVVHSIISERESDTIQRNGIPFDRRVLLCFFIVLCIRFGGRDGPPVSANDASARGEALQQHGLVAGAAPSGGS